MSVVMIWVRSGLYSTSNRILTPVPLANITYLQSCGITRVLAYPPRRGIDVVYETAGLVGAFPLD
jgi:hypothetical protein